LPAPEPPKETVAFDSGVRVIVEVVQWKNEPARLRLSIGEYYDDERPSPLLTEAEARRVMEGIRQALDNIEALSKLTENRIIRPEP
jgi:hypothetical protein